jgi:pimeloyl-ACP methyl ester carboxylesterase
MSNYAAVVSFVKKYAWSRTAPPDLVLMSGQQMMQSDPEVVYGDYLACNSFNIANRLHEMTAPTLVICGSDDKMTPIANSQHLAQHITGAKLISIEGAGHMLAQEQPELVSTSIIEFLSAL